MPDDGRNSASSDTPIQVSLLTGFLGSGKTTLLNRLVRHPGMEESAVLINEFGEIGLDHQLIERIDDNTVLLNAGCLCCTVQSDLARALSELFVKRMKKEVPEFRRVLIETTGLADPAPVIHTLVSAPLVSGRFALDGIIATVDAINAEAQLNRHPEAVKQAAVADRIVITKSDLGDEPAIARLEARLAVLNPAAPRYRAVMGEIDPGMLFDAGLYNPRTKTADVRRWLREEAYEAAGYDHGDHHDHHDVNRHDSAISAFCMTREEPINWDAFVAWLRILIGQHGERLLRIKGILNISGRDRPIAIHGVQHLFHDPAELPAWPDADHSSKIVLITRDLDRRVIEGKLDSLEEQARALNG